MEPRVQELITLKTIAETLNQSNELSPMLNTVLEKLLDLTGLAAGWIFLVDGYMDYTCVADCNLPPALLHDDKRPMQCGRCWCLDRYWDGRLRNAVNILNCKRLEDAIAYRWGDTNGITHHATVPLRAGDRRIGVLNVAGPGKNHFTDEELALLQAVAFQIGGAIERMRLYAAEQRRAGLFARLGEFSRELGLFASGGADPDQLAERAVALIGAHFDWPVAALLEPAGGELVLRAVHAQGRTLSQQARVPASACGWLRDAAHERRLTAAAGAEAAAFAGRGELRKLLPPIVSALAAPLPFGTDAAGVLVIGDEKASGLSRVDGEVVEALAEHIAVVVESARLEEQRRELARLEERNRLARDLHDSVSQMLFSLSMTAKGVESLLTGADIDSARLAVRDMQALSQHALKEMRELIMQLRPAGIEAGLVTALKAYAEKLGLRVSTQNTGVRELPRPIEEALWRIGQEALNNVCKHAGTTEAEVTLLRGTDEIVLSVSDSGRGMPKRNRPSTRTSLGLSTMRERAEALGGRFTLTSAYRNGTTIQVVIPLPHSKSST